MSQKELDSYVPKEIEYDESNLSLTEEEKSIFIDKDGKCLVYVTSDDTYDVLFNKKQHRDYFIQQYLAYFALYIEQNINGIDEKSIEKAKAAEDKIIVIKYNGDRDIVGSASDPIVSNISFITHIKDWKLNNIEAVMFHPSENVEESYLIYPKFELPLYWKGKFKRD